MESFSYSISHDLRAPLRAIEGFSRMVLKKEALSLEPTHTIAVIRSNARKMDRLVCDLLGFSRVGRSDIFRTRIDMKKMINELWLEQLSANPDRKMELKESEIPEAVGDEVLIPAGPVEPPGECR